MTDFGFYKGKKVFVTGHTGFKGSWLCEVLTMLGADVTGYSLNPPTDPALFNILSLKERMTSIIGDIRDLDSLMKCMQAMQPEIVIHMAAQPIVRESYKKPVYTYDVNVMGTVNILECVRMTDSVRSFINVTTDKVYKNKEWEWGYRENEELNGYDPYSNSKSCSELVTDSYKNSFFYDRDIAVSTMRAGNVVGGGDFAQDRIIPDCVKAAMQEKDIIIRNPYSVRPYQHVLEPVMTYLLVAQKQYKDRNVAGSYNVGPDENSCLKTGEIADLFCNKWNEKTGKYIEWLNRYDGGPHEASYLRLDCSRLKQAFGWRPFWPGKEMIDNTVEWYVGWVNRQDMRTIMHAQINHMMQNYNKS